jgi:transcriptional regulator with XRE-family HTH domain
VAELKVRLGDTIKRRRLARKMEQPDLAREVSRRLHKAVTEDQISRWETGKNLIRLDVLLAIAGVFEASLDELVIGEEPFHQAVAKTVEARLIPRIERLEKHLGLGPPQ